MWLSCKTIHMVPIDLCFWHQLCLFVCMFHLLLKNSAHYRPATVTNPCFLHSSLLWYNNPLRVWTNNILMGAAELFVFFSYKSMHVSWPNENSQDKALLLNPRRSLNPTLMPPANDQHLAVNGYNERRVDKKKMELASRQNLLWSSY